MINFRDDPERDKREAEEARRTRKNKAVIEISAEMVKLLTQLIQAFTAGDTISAADYLLQITEANQMLADMLADEIQRERDRLR